MARSDTHPTEARLLVVVPRGGPGGAQLAAAELATALASRGLAVSVACGPGGLPAWSGPVHPLPRLDRRPTHLGATARAVRSAVVASGADLVHNHGVGTGVAVALATRRGRRPAALTTVHGLDPADHRGAARALRLAGLPVVAVGPVVTDWLGAHHVRAAATITNGIGPPPDPVPRRRLLDELGLAGDPTLVVAVGRLVPPKDPLALVRALPHLPGAAAVLVGDGLLASEVRAEADRLGVADRVRITGWRDDARAVLAAADVAVVASRWEGQGRVVIEAMAAGVPVVASGGPVFAGLVDDGGNGVLVDTDDPVALAGVVTALLADPARRDRLVDAGLATAARHTLDAAVDAHLALYRRLLPDAVPLPRPASPAPSGGDARLGS